MKERLSTMRQTLRTRHRNYIKNHFFLDRRQKILRQAQLDEANNLSLTVDSFKSLLNSSPPSFDELSSYLSNPSNCDLFRSCMPQVIQKIALNSNLLSSWTLAGNLCSIQLLDRLYITPSLISSCMQFLNAQSQPAIIRTMLWVLAGLAPLCQGENYETLKVYLTRQHLQRLEKGFCDEYVELLAGLKRVDEAIVRRVVQARLKDDADQRVLEGIAQIIEKAINEDSSQAFLIYIVNLAEGVLSGKYPRRFRGLMTELIGVACCVNRISIVDYILNGVLFQQLLTRSRIDSHEMKLTVINVLCSILIVSNQTQIKRFVQGGFPQVLCRSLGYEQPDILFQVLKAICKLLLNNYKPLLKMFDIEVSLNKLQTHQNKYLYELVGLMIDEFFDEEFQR